MTRLLDKFLAQVVAVAIMWVSCAAAAEPGVSISGGVDATGQFYSWTISNGHSLSILYVEIPHYGADTAEAPEDWAGELTNRLGQGGRPGKFISAAEFPSSRIPPGGSAQFSLRLPSPSDAKGIRDALVRFEDGSEVLVSIEVPLKETTGERNVSLIALGVIFILYVSARAVWRARKRATAGSVAPAERPE